MQAIRNSRRKSRLGILIASGLALIGGGVGCLSDDGSDAADPAALAGAVVEGESWVEAWDGNGRSFLGADEITTALGLDPGQTATVEQALAELQATMQERFREIRNRGPKGGNRPGPEGMPGGFGEFEPPMLAFLEAVVPVLDASQVEGLVGLMEEKRAERADQGPRGPRGKGGPGGPGGPGGFMLRAIADLDLTAEQKTALRDLGQESRDEFRSLRESFADGSITAEQLRDNAKALRAELETQLAQILTADQFTALQSAMAEHRTEMTQRRIDGLADGVARRAAFLAAVLELSDAQSASVTAVLEGTISERQSILEQLRDGQIEIEDALYAGYQLAEQTAALIRAELDAGQAATFDALKRLLPGHKGPGGP